MATWTTKKLKELTTKIGSGATPRGGKDSYHKEGTPLIRSLNIYDLSFSYDGLSFIDESQAKQLDNVTVEKDDVLLNITGASVCRCTSVPDNLVPSRVNQHVAIIRADRKNLLGKYLKYVLVSSAYKRELYGLARTGATREALTKIDIENFEIKLPDIEAQSLIASVLSAYDDLIENNEKRIKALEEMAQLLYTEWFVKFKFPGHEKVKMVDSGTEYGSIPEGWEVKRFYDVVNNFDSKRKPISSMKRQKIQGKYPYYGAAKIIDYINDYIFDGRYLLVAEDGSVITPDGKPMLQFVDEKFWVSNHAHIVQGKLLSTEILYLRLCRFNIKSLITGSAQPKITKDNLSRIVFIVPGEDVKNAFGAIVSHCFDEIFNLQKQDQNLSKTRDLLIPQLVTGKRIFK